MEYLSPEAVTQPIEPRTIGSAHLCVVVVDIMDVWRRLLRAGVEFVGEPVQMTRGPNAGGWGVYARDPDGIIVQIIERAARPDTLVSRA
jgi:catechol 2,3-dioxygenase-like lactoylglutathione lyase family enzyme